jgi:hypothetical protein
MKYSHSKAMAVFYKIVKLVKNGVLMMIHILEYKSDLRRDGNDYLSKNAEQEVSVKLGLDYQQGDIITSTACV